MANLSKKLNIHFSNGEQVMTLIVDIVDSDIVTAGRTCSVMTIGYQPRPKNAKNNPFFFF